MKNQNTLAPLFNPKSIVVMGGGLAVEVVRQLDLIGYQGQVWGVNPRPREMAGRSCFSSLNELPQVPEAAFLAIPRNQTITAVAQLSKMGCKGAVCFASGFAEIGDEGAQYEHQLVAAAKGMPIVGPNCYGLLNFLDGVTLWPDHHGGQRLDTGVAILAQSGNMSITISMQQRFLPIAYLISIGNQASLTIPDYVAALLQDERVTAIGLHIEGLKDVSAFSKVALKALQKKIPIVVLKTGKSPLGKRVARSHTSSLSGSDQLYTALFNRLGILQVDSVPELLEALKLLSLIGPLPGIKIASISSSGGEAALLADRAEKIGLTFPPLNQTQIKALTAVLGPKVPLSNPLDYHTYIWGNPTLQFECFDAMLQGEQNITLKILDYPNPARCDPTLWIETGRQFGQAVLKRQVPGAVLATLHENIPSDVGRALMAQGVAPMLGVNECLKAILGAGQMYKKQQSVHQILPISKPRPSQKQSYLLDEFESKKKLAAIGIPIPRGIVCDSKTVVETAQRVGFPVVLKILSTEIIHKSEVGAVSHGLNSVKEVKTAVRQMQHLGSQFLVEALVPPPIVELILGVAHDPHFGKAITIGAGGLLVELLQDFQTLLLPLLPQEVEEALDLLRISPLLHGYRGKPMVNRQTIIDVILRVGEFAEEWDDSLMEMEINPLFVDAVGVTAVDATMRFFQPDA